MKYNEVVRLVNEILGEYQEATIRQIYYRMVSPPYQYMDNTKSMYCSFDKFLTTAREKGDIDWRKIADHTRTAIKPESTYASIEEFMQVFKDNVEGWWTRYTVDLWADQDYRVKVFIEKDALAGVVSEVSLRYQVATFPGRGYNSFTQLRSLAEELRDIDKSIIILYFGDFDPSGLDIDRSATKRIKEYAGRDDIEVVRCALTEDDVINLPANPTKLTDKRAASYIAKYGDRCWELDALPPDQLRNRVESAIKQYIDLSKYSEAYGKMQAEKAEIQEIISNLWNEGK